MDSSPHRLVWITLLLVGVPVSLPACRDAGGGLGKLLGRLGGPPARGQRLEVTDPELLAQERALRLRIAMKQSLAAEVVAGRMTLSEAAGQARALQGDESDTIRAQ